MLLENKCCDTTSGISHTPTQLLSTLSKISERCSTFINIDELTTIVDNSDPNFSEGDFKEMLLILTRIHNKTDKSSDEKISLRKLMRYANTNGMEYVNGS